MNKIYKVIWSKAKHTYVVASEIAKGHTKGETTGRGLKKLAAALLVAAALMGPNFAWAADIVKVEPAADTASTTAVEVYTKDGAEKEISTLSTLIGNNATQIGNNATQIGNNATNIKSNTDKISKLESAVGDDDSGLKKDVNDLKTTVGDSTGGLVKDVADSKTAIDNEAAVRQSADKQLQTNIDNEAAAREAEDARLNSEIVKTNTSLNEAASNLSKLNDTVAKGFEDLRTEDKTLQTNIENEAATRESADSALDSRTSALEAKTGSLNRVAAANSTSINESMTLKDKQYSATLQVNGSGAQIGAVNNSMAGLANDGGTAYTEYRARTGVILSKATSDISSTSSNGQVVDTAGDTTGEYSQAATKSTGTTFTYSNDGGKTSSSTTIKGNSVSTGTVSATAGITDETTKDGTSVIASQTVGQNLNALDERITNVKEYLEKQTSDTYVSKDDAAVQDGAIVKADKTIGENVTNLDAALAKETAARLGADAAQDKVIKQVNDNLVASVNTINKNMSDGFTALSQADANELAGRMAADKELVKATNGGLALNDKNVLQKNETIIAEDGTVKTTTTAADTLIMNEGKTNQITLSENGIKVGLNSGVMDKDGFYAGGDTAEAAKAALNADGSIKGAGGIFTVDGTTGNVSTKGSLAAASGTIGNVSMSADGTVTGVKDLTASGKVTADSFTDGTATMSNGSLNGVNQINATGNIVTTDNMKAHDITAEGMIKGENINGTTGTFGSLTTTGNASVGGTLTTNGITNTGNATTDTLKVNHNATVGGDLAVTGDITGKSLNVGTGAISGGQITGTGLDVGAGTIKTTGAVETGTLETTGNAEIGGDLTVDKNLTVNGTFDAKTLSSTVDANNYTTINGGNVTSHNMKLSDVNGRTYTSTSKFNEEGRTDTAADGTTTNVSVMTAGGSDSTISSLADANQKSYITQNLKKILQGIKNGTNESTVDQTETGIKSTATDGKNTASTNLSNKGFNTFASDGTNKTYTKQTATDIKNTAENGTISNTAKDLVNNASENMTNTVSKNLETTVGGEMKTTVTGKVTEDFKSDLTTTIGGNKSEEVKGTSTETVTGKKTENYNGGLETTVAGEEKHTVNGSQTNSITGDQVNTIGGKQTTTVTGDVTEDYKANLSTTVGGSQTTTVTGDSILTAENINNTAKNKITNKALDVETDAASSIVSKVSNDYGSNTSTQLSYQTTEEMSQADGKTASYLRGAAEEKSQLTNGAKKTTIDTVAGQTNTNITDGTNTSNDLQKADQIASSVTDGTNTTVVNQNAKSLASSITDGAKANNTNNTVDKSEQLIKASDTQYSATSKTATKMEDALVSGSSIIDVIKNLDDAANPLISSAVTDGTNSTGVTQTAKDITNTAEKGTIANNAKDITNNATENMTNTVGKDLTTTVGGNQTTTVTGDSSLTAKNITNTASEKITNQIGDGSAVKSEMTADGITNTAEGGTIYNKSEDILNEVSGDILNFADGEIGNSATKITNLTGDNTVTSDTNGTTFENKAHNTAVKEGTVTKTTISGNTITTGEAVMDYADVMKDLGVRGNAAVDGNTTLGKEGAETTLTVNSTSTFNKDVTMKENATVKKNLTVDGATNLKGDAIIGTDANNTLTVNSKSTFNNGVTVTNGTTTDTLKVTGSSEFDGKATFNDIVTMNKGLSVTGGVTADTVTADSYKVGDKTYIDKDGINANNQVIRNVGQGDISAGSTDAVSGGQLYETNTRVSGLETRMGTVETRVDKLDNKIDKVGANAAAMANLHPLEFDEDSKWNIAAAVGSSGSETASAVGVFYRPNENVMVNASAAMGTGENMFGGGVSLRLGHGGNKAKEAQMKAAAAENKELRAKVDDLTARMDALLSVLNPNMSKDFPDVPENHWAYEAVSRLAGNGIVEGYEDGKYHGERQMTRYEMAEIIYNALSKGAKAEKKLVEEFRPELQAMVAQKKA